MAHPLAGHCATLQSTPRSRSSPQWTTSRLGPLLALTLAIALLALVQPACAAPVAPSVAPFVSASASASAAAADAHSAERSEEALEQPAPGGSGSAQAANIVGNLQSPAGQGPAHLPEGMTAAELTAYNRHANGPYHQRGSRRARSAQHRCNTTMAEYRNEQERFLEVRKTNARTVGFEPAGTKRKSAKAKRPRHSRGAKRFF